MTLNQLATKVFGLDWRVELATVMKVHRTTVLRWENGTVPIPQSVFVALKCLLKAQHP
jgi:hypothetical protein